MIHLGTTLNSLSTTNNNKNLTGKKYYLWIMYHIFKNIQLPMCVERSEGCDQQKHWLERQERLLTAVVNTVHGFQII